MTLDAGNQGNQINVQGVLAGTRATINAGNGANTLTVRNLFNNLSAVQGLLTLNGGTGTNNLTLDDEGAGAAESYTLGASQLVRAASAPEPAVTIDYFNMSSLDFQASDLPASKKGTNTIVIQGTAAGTPTEVDTGHGTNLVTVENLSMIQAPLTLASLAGAANALAVNDSAANTPGVVTYFLNAGTVQGNGSALIEFANFELVGLEPGNTQNNSVNVQSTAVNVSYVISSTTQLAASTDAFNVGDANDPLSQILGPLTFFSGHGQNALTIDDQDSSTANMYALTSTTLTPADAATISYKGLSSLLVNGSSLGNTFTVTGTKAGTATALSAGAGPDTIKLAGNAAAYAGPLSIDGQTGLNALDYSSFSGPVTVDLRLGIATAVAGGIHNIQNVIGGSGNDLFVGNGQGNVLRGGTGRNILIAGDSPGTLIGNVNQDLLVGGTTKYDTNLVALDAIMAEWANSAPYTVRVPLILNGGGLNGKYHLGANDFTNNGGGNVLTGGPGLDLFYGIEALDTNDWNPALGEVFVQNAVATPQVSVNPVDIYYGTALDNSQLSGTAVVNGQTMNVPGSFGSFTYTTAAGTILDDGTGQTEVTFTPAEPGILAPVTTTVTVNVSPVTPTVVTNPVNIVYGTALDDSQLIGTCTATALYNGQTATLPGVFRYVGGDGTVLNVGNDQFEEVEFIANDANYYITDADVIVNVAPAQATPSITWNTPDAITYGTALDATQLDASANVDGSFSYSPAAGAVLSGGTQTLNVTFTPNDTTDYTTATASVQLVVNPATPTVTLSSSPTPDYYADNLTFTAVVQSSAGTPQGAVTFLDGTQTLGYSSLQNVNGSQQATFMLNWLAIGSHSITAVYSDTVDNNFATASSSVLSQSVNATPFDGYTLQFSGFNNYVQVANGLNMGDTVTLAAWIYLQQLPSTAGQSMYIMGNADGEATLNLQVGMDNKIHLNANATSLTSNTVLQAGIWYFVVGTFQGQSDSKAGQLQIFINGTQDAALTGAFGRLSNSDHDSFTMGASSFVPGQYFQGFIAAPSVWSTVLSQTAIQSAMTNGLTGNETDLIAYWPFDEGSGTIAHDLSPNANNGVLGTGTSDEPAWVTLG